MQWEFAVLDWIQTYWRSPLWDDAIAVFSTLWDHGVPWILLAVCLLCRKSTRKTGRSMAIAMILELVVVSLLMKPLVGRVRPCNVRPLAELLIPRPGTASFPSGHSAHGFAVTGALFYRRSKLTAPVFVLSVLLALSRLYLYVHFPTDVLAGIAIGWLCGWAGVQIEDWLEKRRRKSTNGTHSSK